MPCRLGSRPPTATRRPPTSRPTTAEQETARRVGSVSAMPAHLPPALTPLRGLTQWSIDPYALVLIALACAAYLLSVRRLRRAGENWPAGRAIAFCLGGGGLSLLA